MSTFRRALAVCVAGCALALAACGSGMTSGTITVGNTPPVITSLANVSLVEDTAGVFYNATATDANGDTVSFTISGGPDAALFNMTTAGALSFNAPPDFEAPLDAGNDNTYNLVIAANDGISTATLALAVTVTDLQSARAQVRRVTFGLSSPVLVAAVPDGSGRVFVGELAGRIRIVTPSNGAVAAVPFLDLRGTLSTSGERGLLGFATAPDYATSGLFYVFVTDPAGTIEVRRYRRDASNPDIADPSTMQLVLTQPHPALNHNGGWIGFGPDNFLYIAIGDGGGSGDPDNNAQNLNTWLGKILRVDVARDDFASDATRNYGIPADNPFAHGGGAPEIWSYGLRNPFRASFYVPPSGGPAPLLLIGDVGENAVEEIDLAMGNDNFGWSQREGTQQFKGPDSPDFSPPVAEYLHGAGTRNGDTVIGGIVYSGPVESLRGQYFFADFINGNLWSLPATALVPGTTIGSAQFIVHNTDLAPDAGAMNNLVSFGEDQSHNLYIVDMDGELFVIEAAPTSSPLKPSRAQRMANRSAATTLHHWCVDAWDGRTVRWKEGQMLLAGQGFTCVRKYYDAQASQRIGD
jgi:hypothetical protein